MCSNWLLWLTGEIYLSAIHTTMDHGYIRQLTHSEFEVALVHCAIVAYEKKMEARSSFSRVDLFVGQNCKIVYFVFQT